MKKKLTMLFLLIVSISGLRSEILLFDTFESFSGHDELRRIYDQFREVDCSSELPELSLGIAAQGAKSLRLTSNGRALKVKLPTAISSRDAITLEAKILFEKKTDNSLSLMFGDSKVSYSHYTIGLLLPNLTDSNGWKQIKYILMPEEDGSRKVVMSIDGQVQATLTSVKCHGSMNTHFRIGYNGSIGNIYIDDLKISRESLDERRKSRLRTSGKIMSLTQILDACKGEALTSAIYKKLDIDGDGIPEPMLLNQDLILAFTTSRGAACFYFIDRKTGKNLAGKGGMFKDFFWSEDYNDQPFVQITYDCKPGVDAKGSYIEFSAKGTSGPYIYITIRRRVHLSHSLPLVSCKLSYHNDPNSVGALTVMPWCHHEIGIVEHENTFHLPGPYGIEEIRQASISADRFFYQPTRGWLAMTGQNAKRGLMATVDYPHLQCFYTWCGGMSMPTFEWRLYPIRIPQDAVFSYDYEFRLFEKEFTPVAAGRHGTIISMQADRHSIRGQVFPVNSPVTGELCHSTDGKNFQKLATCITDSRGSFTMTPDTPLATGVYRWNAMTADKELIVAEIPYATGKKVFSYEMHPLQNRLTPADDTHIKRITHEYMTQLQRNYETPHYAWGKPISGKRLKVLVLVPAIASREVVELEQRFDVECDFVYINQGPPWVNGDYFYTDLDPMSIRSLRKALQKDYDVICLGGIYWNQYLNDGIGKTIADKIKNGTGLVYVTPSKLNAQAEAIVGKPHYNRLYTASNKIIVPDHPLTGNLDFSLFDVMESNLKFEGLELVSNAGNSLLNVRQFGKGRVALLSWPVHSYFYDSCGGGLTPFFPPNQQLPSGPLCYDYHEYYFALIGKCMLWSAHALPAENHQVGLQSVTLDSAGMLMVKLKNGSPSARLSGELCDRYGRKYFSFNVPLKGVETQLKLERKPYWGTNFMRYRLLDEKQRVMDFGAKRIAGEKSIIHDLNIVNSQKTIAGTVSLAKGPYDNLEILLYDGFGRLCQHKKKTNASGKITFDLDAKRMRSYGGTVEVRCLDENQKVMDCCRKECVRKSYPKDAFVVSASEGMKMGYRPYLLPHYYHWLRELGANQIASTAAYRHHRHHGFHVLKSPMAGMGDSYANSRAGKYQTTGDKRYLIRKRCFSDPSFLQSEKEQIQKILNEDKDFNGYYCMYDEDEYSQPGFDYDFNPLALAEFRRYLKKEYQTLDALNRQWDSHFSTWNQVEPKTFIEARKCTNHNYSAWVDHRLFNNLTVKNAWSFYKNIIQAKSPDHKIGQSGTRPSLAYGGNDWYYLMNVMDFVRSYPFYQEQYAYQLSFSDIPIYPWLGGYANQDASWLLFNTLKGGNGGLAIYHVPSIVKHDLSGLNGPGLAARKAVEPLLEGRGKLFYQRREKGEIGIYFSMPSRHVAWIVNREKTFEDSWKALVKMLESTLIPYRFIASQQVLNHELRQNPPKIMVLPCTLALSPAECQELADYVRSGGVLIADALPGVMDGHGKLLPKSGLQAMFKNQIEGLDIPPLDRRKGFGHNSYWTEYGKGKTLCLNQVFSTEIITAIDNIRDSEWRQSALATKAYFEKAFAMAGVKSILSISPQYYGKLELLEFNIDAYKHCLVLYSKYAINKLSLTLPEGYYWYDSLSSTYLGQGGDNHTLSLAAPVILTGLKAPYKDFTMTLDKSSLNAGDSLSVTINSNQKGYEVYKCILLSPDGKQRICYDQEVESKDDAPVMFTYMLALDEIKGTWTLKVIQASTGHHQSHHFNVR